MYGSYAGQYVSIYECLVHSCHVAANRDDGVATVGGTIGFVEVSGVYYAVIVHIDNGKNDIGAVRHARNAV